MKALLVLRFFLLALTAMAVLSSAHGQATHSGRFKPTPPDPANKPVPPKTTGLIDFVGNTSYTADQLKEPMAEQIKEIDKEGLTPSSRR